MYILRDAGSVSIGGLMSHTTESLGTAVLLYVDEAYNKKYSIGIDIKTIPIGSYLILWVMTALNPGKDLSQKVKPLYIARYHGSDSTNIVPYPVKMTPIFDSVYGLWIYGDIIYPGASIGPTGFDMFVLSDFMQ